MNEIKLHPNMRYWFLMNFVHIILTVCLFVFRTVFDEWGHYFRTIAGCAAMVIVCLMFWNIIVLMNIQYLIQDEQIVIKRGVLRKTVNYMEMYRIFDYQKKQNIIESVLGLMNVVILSRDLSNPQLLLFGIQNDDAIIPEIRRRVELQKKIKNIHEFNNPL